MYSCCSKRVARCPSDSIGLRSTSPTVADTPRSRGTTSLSSFTRPQLTLKILHPQHSSLVEQFPQRRQFTVLRRLAVVLLLASATTWCKLKTSNREFTFSNHARRSCDQPSPVFDVRSITFSAWLWSVQSGSIWSRLVTVDNIKRKVWDEALSSYHYIDVCRCQWCCLEAVLGAVNFS